MKKEIIAILKFNTAAFNKTKLLSQNLTALDNKPETHVQERAALREIMKLQIMVDIHLGGIKTSIS